MDAEGRCERSQDLRATRRVSGVCGFGVECGGGAWIRRVFRDQPDSSCPQPTASALFSLSSVSAAGGSLAFAAPCSAAVHAGGWFRAFTSGQRPVVPIRPPKVRPGDPAMMAATQSTVKVACIQLAVGADKKQNIANAAAKISEAAGMGAELVVLPECMNSPYGVKYFPEYAESVVDGNSETAEMLSTAAQKAGVFLVGGSFPERDGDKLYNSCFVFNKDGDMIARHRKIHLFDIDIPGKITFKESDSLSPGDAPTVVDLSEHGGPPVRMGIGICYDIRFSELATIYRQLGSAPVSERFQ